MVRKGRLRCARYIAFMQKIRNIYKVLREPEGKWLLGKTSLSGLNSFNSE